MGTEPFKQQQFGPAGVEGVKLTLTISKKSESKYVSALPKILNGLLLRLLTWRSAMSSIIFGLLGNAHLFNWLFRWLVGVDMWCQSCRPEVRIRRRVREKIRGISNLLKMFEVRTLSNLNANFFTSLLLLLHTVDTPETQYNTTENRWQMGVWISHHEAKWEWIQFEVCGSSPQQIKLYHWHTLWQSGFHVTTVKLRCPYHTALSSHNH